MTKMEAWEIADKNGNPCDVCGHPWRRHLDSYDYNHLGCKYCECTIAPPGLMSRQDKINQFKNNNFDLFFIECSFCGYKPDTTRDLVIGPRVSICKDCVTFAAIDQGLIKDKD